MVMLRWLLFPFSIIYWLIGSARNALYSYRILQSQRPTIPSICIGNLSLGGTGKSPMTNYLIQLLKSEQKVIVLSRGYGRSSSGFLLVNESHSSQDVGDEPLAYKLEHGESISVAVAENRWKGIEALAPFSQKSVLLLDDAYQHRSVCPGFTVLLSTYDAPFYNDFVLPTGNLREGRRGANRADIIVITKCPKDMSQQQKQVVLGKLAKYNKKVFFSSITYSPIIPIGKLQVKDFDHVLLVTGIANPFPLLEHLKKSHKIAHINFPDHHNYSAKDLVNIHQKFNTFVNVKSILVTTSKDYMRLKNAFDENELSNYPWYIQPMSVEIENENEFNQLIKHYVRKI
jgi:tetraacyldisaccharide 4'-kinase